VSDSLVELVLCWYAPLIVHSARHIHQSPVWTDSESHRSLHLGRGSWISGLAEYSWTSLYEDFPVVSSSFPVEKLLRSSYHLLCVVRHLCHVPKQGESPWLDYWPRNDVAWLSVSLNHSIHTGTTLAAFVDTADEEHRSCAYVELAWFKWNECYLRYNVWYLVLLL